MHVLCHHFLFSAVYAHILEINQVQDGFFIEDT